MKIALTLATGGDSYLYGIPLGIGYIAKVLKARIPEAEIMVSQDWRDIVDFKPRFLGVSAVSCTVHNARSIAAAAKMEIEGVATILGGAHVTNLPRLLPPEFDAGVIGEGEDSLTELVQKWGKGMVSGIVYGANSLNGERRILRMKDRPVRTDLDTFPFPLRGQNPRTPTKDWMITSRGCPFKCPFCSSGTYWPNYRTHSAEYMVDEIKDILRQFPQVTTIHMQDDLFSAKIRRLEEFVILMQKAGLHKRVNFHITTKSSINDEPRFKLFKAMNTKEVRFGLESASQRILDILKEGTTPAMHARSAELAKKYGVKLSASTMVGVPGETKKDLDKTINFAYKYRGLIRLSGWYLTTPLPGTDFWKMALEMGIVEESVDFDFSRMISDWRNPSFDPSKAYYMNAEQMPLTELIDYMKKTSIWSPPKKKGWRAGCAKTLVLK